MYVLAYNATLAVCVERYVYAAAFVSYRLTIRFDPKCGIFAQR